MLRASGRRGLPLSAGLLLVAALLAAPLWLNGGSAMAAVGPCLNTDVCVGASTPPGAGGGSGGSSGGGGGGGGVQVCVYGGANVPCSTSFGSFDPDDGCYYALVQPQPPAGDLDWHGHAPGDGAVYMKTCPYSANPGSANVWLAAAPAVPPVVTPAELAQRALDRIHRTAAKVRTAPDAVTAKTALVGAPIWLWIEKTDTDYATKGAALSATAAVPGLSVTAYVYVTEVDWDMGDGGASPHCGTGTHHNPAGTPYTAADAGRASPDCGYTYTRPSIGQPDQRYAITANVHWIAVWVASNGAGGTFVLDPIPSPATTLRVSELQVLN